MSVHSGNNAEQIRIVAFIDRKSGASPQRSSKRKVARVIREEGALEFATGTPSLDAGPRGHMAQGPLTRFLVRRGASIVPIAVHQIERIEAARDYVAVYVNSQPSLVYIGMTELVMRLDPDRFVRVHRSHIVNLDYVANIRPRGDGRLMVTMRDKTPITASRTGSRVLRERALSR